MSSAVRSWQSLGGDKEQARHVTSGGGGDGDIVKMGYLKKLKTMKKKFFVLRGDSSEASARLEYYDSEKKFKTNHVPKRSITLKTCFNINKRSDTRQKWVIALYTKNDCFCLVMETEEELEDWLKMLLKLQHGEDVPDGEQPKPTFEHVWQVTVQKKELGHSRNILGPYLLCLTDRTLSLVKMDSDSEKPDTIEFSLQSIRRCGDLESFFYMEVGQMSVTGAGNLWMQTEDNNIAQNMHAAILSACRNCKDFVPISRIRSHSTNESSRPISVSRPSHDGHSRVPGHFGLSGVRERCDSLPTRPRTTSEGATTHIPQHPPRGTHLRPHSMYNRTISYSPPVDSSPVSPESRASTDSAGSSLSMEGDGMGLGDGTWESGPDRYGHSLTPEEPVIMEENSDECENVNIHWHPGDDYVGPDKQICPSITNHLSHKNSPNPSSSGFRSSSPSQGSLADMCSPCGSSPLETSGAYMPMSPGEKPIIMPNNFGGLRTGISSVNHSRGSSLAEDGYVHMAPMLHDDGYVDMGQGVGAGHHRRNIPDHYRSGDLSPASSCSITSGTPSTDIRFSEYNLEKVSTYITPSEDEIVPSERPARAYSVGSRPTFNKRNDVVNQSECQQRVRAFSVGSRCPRVHTAHLTPPPRHPLSSSHSSVEHQEDLMEMDFTKNNKSRSRLYSKKPSSSERLSVPPSSVASSAASSYSTAEGSYMEMSPRSSPKPSDNEMDSSHFCPSPPKSNRITIGRSPPKSYMDMKPSFSSSPPVTGGLGHSSIPLYKVPEGESGYVEMSTGCRSELTGSSPPVVISQLSMRDDRGRSLSEDSSYMEMNPIETRSIIAKASAPRVDSFPVTEQFKQQSFSKPSNSPPIKQALISTSNILKTKANQDDYLDMNAKRKYSLVEDNNNKIVIGRTNPIDTPKKTPDGYVEMTLGNLKPIRKSSLESIKVGDSDYMNMSGGGKKERRGSRKDRNRYSSQPITIQSTPSKEQSSSTSPVFTFVGRKHSTGTPPKVPSYLPLGNYSTSPSSSPYSSLGRRTRKTPSRRDSKELSSSGCSTPIFPLSLNSPSSPMKPFNQGSNNNNNNNSNTTNNNNNSNSKDKESYESAAKCPVDATSGTVRISYSPADHPLMPHPLRQQSSGVANYVEQNDYVNFNPLISELKESSSCSDYTPMKPVNPLDPSRKISAPPVLNNCTGKTRSIDKLVTGMNNLTVSSPEINSVPKNNSNHNSNNCSNISNSNMCTVTVTVTSANNVVTDETRFNSVETVPSTCISEINSSSKCNSDIVVLSSDKISANVCDSGKMVASVATTAAATSDSSFVPSISPTVLINSTASVTTGVNQNVTAINSLTSATNAANSSSAAATASTGNNSTVPTSTTTVTTTAITGDKELHYASLDLVRSSSVEETTGSNATSSSSNANRPLRNQSSTSSASTPSPNINQNTAPALMYAEIDFSKSGNSSSNSNNTNSTVH